MPLSHHAAATLLCLLLGATAPLHAEPEHRIAPPEGVMQLLQDNNLLHSQQPNAQPVVHQHPIVQQVREKASGLVMAAMNFIGVRYRMGGNNAEQGFDCSGFTRYVFEHSIGLVLPRRADEQANNAGLRSVRQEELRPGDLVFFNTMRRAFSHVGIYVGEGKFIHSPRSGGEVRIEDMRQAYWSQRFNGARRAEAATWEGSGLRGQPQLAVPNARQAALSLH
jgi:cell wall-associated NlpC family hydrolase